MDLWIVKDKIKNGQVLYHTNDIVTIFRRKGKYPKLIEDNIDYTIQSVENDFLLVRKHSSDGVGWMQPIKVHKTYMIHKEYLRDIKIDLLLK